MGGFFFLGMVKEGATVIVEGVVEWPPEVEGGSHVMEDISFYWTEDWWVGTNVELFKGLLELGFSGSGVCL